MTDIVKALAKMPEYQQRVIGEKIELDTKINALKTFRGSEQFKAIDKDEQGRLIDQLQTMKEYSQILAERILCFK